MATWVTVPVFAKSACPFPGVSVTPDLSLPPNEGGVFLFDIGLTSSVRSFVYGVGVSLIDSSYKDEMMGVQVGTLLCYATKTYGAQFGLSNSAKKGFGTQVGLMNFYNDESFRVQIGLWNTQQFSLNWNYGPVSIAGGRGFQLGLLNSSSEGGHVQFGMFNLGKSTAAVQIGLFNSVTKNSRCIQIGLLNDMGDVTTPFFGCQWWRMKGQSLLI